MGIKNVASHQIRFIDLEFENYRTLILIGLGRRLSECVTKPNFVNILNITIAVFIFLKFADALGRNPTLNRNYFLENRTEFDREPERVRLSFLENTNFYYGGSFQV
jgi:hypothetical protein